MVGRRPSRSKGTPVAFYISILIGEAARAAEPAPVVVRRPITPRVTASSAPQASSIGLALVFAIYGAAGEPFNPAGGLRAGLSLRPPSFLDIELTGGVELPVTRSAGGVEGTLSRGDIQLALCTKRAWLAALAICASALLGLESVSADGLRAPSNELEPYVAAGLSLDVGVEIAEGVRIEPSVGVFVPWMRNRYDFTVNELETGTLFETPVLEGRLQVGVEVDVL